MLTVVPAAGELQPAALTLLYCRLPRGERERQLAHLLESVQRADFDLDNLLIALRDGNPVGALLAVVRPGRMAFLWPPVLHPGESGTLAAEELLRTAAGRLDAAGVVVTQCLLEKDDAVGREVLNASGFPYSTDILLLSRPVDDLEDLPAALDESLTIRAYDLSSHDEFKAVIERTYIDTLDCPGLSSCRSAEDALTSYRAASNFDGALWQLGCIDGKGVGVLLEQEHRERLAREIVYLGIVPEARRKGLGRALLVRSLNAANAAGIESCEVAVDSENRYALNLYRALGFEEQRRFAVHLRLRAPY